MPSRRVFQAGRGMYPVLNVWNVSRAGRGMYPVPKA